MSDVEETVEIYKEDLSCSQAVFGAFCERFGMDRQQAFKISSGFGGGMHLDQTCGAVTGAFMAIGLKFGRTRADDVDAKKKMVEMTDEFAKRFEQRCGSIRCTDLLGYNLATDAGREEAQKLKATKAVCPKYVQAAAEILAEMLA